MQSQVWLAFPGTALLMSALALPIRAQESKGTEQVLRSFDRHSQAITDVASASKPSKALAEGDRIRIGRQEYVLQVFKNGTVGRVERRGAFCLWKGGTVWVVDPLRPDLKDRFAFPWPIEALSADRSLAVVRLPAKKDLLAVADVQKKRLVVELPPEKEPKFYSVAPEEWVFSAHRRHVYALAGVGVGGWYYLDLMQKKRIAVDVSGFRPRHGLHLWSGTVLHGGKEAVIFLSGGDKRDGRRRVVFPLDNPEKRTVAVPDIDVVYVLEAGKDHVTAYLGDGKYGRLSTHTWNLVQRFDWGAGQEVRSPLLHQLGPGGRHGYLINDWHRLVVYDRKSGNLVKILLDEKAIDTRSRGVTFTAAGRHGIVAAKASRIAVFDSHTHEIVHEYVLKNPLTMAFLIEPAKNEKVGTCLVLD
jgi:hypothetical protein